MPPFSVFPWCHRIAPVLHLEKCPWNRTMTRHNCTSAGQARSPICSESTDPHCETPSFHLLIFLSPSSKPRPRYYSHLISGGSTPHTIAHYPQYHRNRPENRSLLFLIPSQIAATDTGETTHWYQILAIAARSLDFPHEPATYTGTGAHPQQW